MEKMLGTSRVESSAAMESVLTSQNEPDSCVDLTDVLSDVANSIESIDDSVLERTNELLSNTIAPVSPVPPMVCGVATNGSSSSEIECTGQVSGTGSVSYTHLTLPTILRV